jgi:crooked neck
MGTWHKYAAWEASQKEWERARSVYERCIDVDYKHHPTWLRYAEVRSAAWVLLRVWIGEHA